MVLWQARQSLIVRGIFPMLADARHQVSTCYVTLLQVSPFVRPTFLHPLLRATG
jgi:hypothetical protein